MRSYDFTLSLHPLNWPEERQNCSCWRSPWSARRSCGVSFIGASGQHLNGTQAAGLFRRDLYLTNVLFTRPPGNKSTNSLSEENQLELTIRCRRCGKESTFILTYSLKLIDSTESCSTSNQTHHRSRWNCDVGTSWKDLHS